MKLFIIIPILLVGVAGFWGTSHDALAQTNSTTQVYVPGVGGTLFDGSSVRAWDARSNEYYGEEFTLQSLATFDTITDVEIIDPVRYTNAGVVGDNIIFGNQKSGTIEIYRFDILGRGGKIDYNDKSAGNHSVSIQKIIPSNWANGVYPIKIITPTEVFDMAINAVDGQYAASRVVTMERNTRLGKVAGDDLVRLVVSGEGHYTRTFTSEKIPLIEDYVVEYVNQLKTDGTAVTPEEFKQYCNDFNAYKNGGKLLTFFPNENKQIWIASRNTLDSTITFTYQQMESIRDLVIEEIYPYIEPANQPSFYLDDPANPEPIPLHETGKIVIFPKSAGYAFATGIDQETGIINYGTVALDDDLNIADTTTQSRTGTLEEVASCLVGPRDNQGPPYGIFGIKTIFVGGGKMYPIDKKLFEIGQKYKPNQQLDDVLGL